MSETGASGAMSAVAGLLGVVGALLVGSVLAEVWNYSAEGAVLLTGGAAGLVGTAAAARNRGPGAGALNSLGLWLGLAALVVAAAMLLVGGYEIEFG